MKQLSDRGIIRREKLFTKHQILQGDRFWWQPKNQTYYYTLNYNKLQELGKKFVLQLAKRDRPEAKCKASECSKPLETSVSIKTQILSNEENEDTKDFDCAKNNTDITSIKNNSRDLSHPHLPCEGESKKENNQDSQDFSNPELPKEKEAANFVNPEVICQDTNDRRVEQNIN